MCECVCVRVVTDYSTLSPPRAHYFTPHAFKPFYSIESPRFPRIRMKEIRNGKESKLKCGGVFCFIPNLVVRKCNNLFFYFICYCMYGLRLRNFAFFKKGFDPFFRSLSCLTHRHFPREKQRKRKQSTLLSILRALYHFSRFFLPCS